MHERRCASSLTETDLLYLRMVFGSFYLVHGQNKAAIMQLMLIEEVGREYILNSLVWLRVASREKPLAMSPLLRLLPGQFGSN